MGTAIVVIGIVLVSAAPALAQTQFTTTTTRPNPTIPPGCVSTFIDPAGVLRPATTYYCPSSTTTTSAPTGPTTGLTSGSTTSPTTTVTTVHHDTTTTDPCAPVAVEVSLDVSTVLNPYQPPRYEGSGRAVVDPLGAGVATITVFSVDDDDLVGHLALSLADGSALESSNLSAHLDGASVAIDAPLDAGSGAFASTQATGARLELHGTWDEPDGGTLALSGTGTATALGCDTGVDVGPAATGTVAPPVDGAADDPDTLPRTGTDPWPLVLIGVTLVATGLGFVARDRRHHHVR
ncbi:MAG TPA: LPXTG cell wall anchor domain-containing protein [Acidimicrobiia bacterium]|nr:LPXTG cell wall anchor domain-containing protein [Acidimicrobiia bacterium]